MRQIIRHYFSSGKWAQNLLHLLQYRYRAGSRDWMQASGASVSLAKQQNLTFLWQHMSLSVECLCSLWLQQYTWGTQAHRSEEWELLLQCWLFLFWVVWMQMIQFNFKDTVQFMDHCGPVFPRCWIKWLKNFSLKCFPAAMPFSQNRDLQEKFVLPKIIHSLLRNS